MVLEQREREITGAHSAIQFLGLETIGEAEKTAQKQPTVASLSDWRLWNNAGLFVRLIIARVPIRYIIWYLGAYMKLQTGALFPKL